MQTNHIRRLGAAVLLLLWMGLAAAGWVLPPKDLSETERRPLAQIPQIGVQSLLSGSFMKDFEAGALDQFPARDSFRRLKALFHYYVLNQSDNNDIYLEDGFAAKLEYPLHTDAVDMAVARLNYVYEKYLKDTDVNLYASVIPDKSYYLAEENGYPVMDYEKLFSTVREGLPWATYVPLEQILTIEDYYKTDIHWRQEKLLPVAQTLAQAMGIRVAEGKSYTAEALERPFYGVYYGQAALPMDADLMYLMKNPVTEGCTVYDYETGKTTAVYDMDKLTSKDLYDVFLSGSKSLLTIENPNAQTDKELIIFRDSFAGSLTPLLLQDYAKITLVDIRYISTEVLGNFLEFTDQDVLFLYCTTVLNTKGILR